MLTVYVYVNWLEEPVNGFKVKDEEEFRRVFIYSKTNNPDRLVLRDEDNVWINRNSITRLDIVDEEDEKADSDIWGFIPVILFIVFVLISVILMICQQSWWRPFN